MFGSFFDVTEAHSYADWVIEELLRWLPPDSEMASKISSHAVQKMNDRIFLRTNEMTETANLNVYKKAQLAARVREKMKALGYPADFIRSFSLDLLTRIQEASTKRSSRKK